MLLHDFDRGKTPSGNPQATIQVDVSLKNEIFAVAVVIALIVGTSIGYSGIAGNAITKSESFTTTSTYTSFQTVTQTLTLRPQTVTQTVTSTSVSTVSTSSAPAQVGANTSIMLASGLSFKLRTNTTTLRAGQGVSINIAMINTLSRDINVTAANRWPIMGLIDNACGTLFYPMGIGVAKGNYQLNNVSSATLLDMCESGPGAGPGGPYPVLYYLFKSGSSYANVSGYRTLLAINATVQISGYWVGSTGQTKNNFDSGMYTVIAGDEWGDLVVLHFVVQ